MDFPLSSYVLAFDTSTDELACALGRFDGLDPHPGAAAQAGCFSVAAESDFACRRQANVELVPTCQKLLDEAGCVMDQVAGIVVGRGPGSFTGVRIGIATAKGLGCGRDCPVMGVSTLDAVAWRAWEAGVRGLVGVVGDAMRHEVYPGLYGIDDAGVTRLFSVETVLKAPEAQKLWALRADAQDIQLTGDGLKKYADLYREAGLTRLLPQELWAPSGTSLLLAASAALEAAAAEKHAPSELTAPGELPGHPALVLPVYTRLSDAEENELKRLGLSEPATAATTGCDDALADRHLQLRPMSVNDLEAVSLLEDAVFAGSEHTPWNQSMFAEELGQPGRSWWVAHDEGQVVGFAGGRLAGDDLEILDVAVSAARRREGIGARLLARVAYDGQVLGARSSSLEVFSANGGARALYESLGYSEAGVRADYYGTGQDAVIMTAALPLSVKPADDRPDPTSQVAPWPMEDLGRSSEAAKAVLAAQPLVLAIESSCDETAMAVIDGSGTILANVVSTQIDFHARFGGVVPEIASRKHTEAIVGVYQEALEQAGTALGCGSLLASDLAAVGVTQGPGLVGALVVGVAFAKGLCAGAGLPLIGVNHLEGHLYANLFETPDLKPPFVASLVSGGHTMLVHVRDWGDYQVLGETIDDAVGEAFDKVAKALGLGYPGGPVISRLATQGNPKAIAFPRAMLHSHDYRFSLSGLKTAVITYIEGENAAGRPINLPDLAASFQAAVIDVQVAKALAAAEECDVDDFCVGGGVAANPALREAYTRALGQRGVRVTLPPLSACTDNAAMIALVALREYRAKKFAPLTMDADPNWSL